MAIFSNPKNPKKTPNFYCEKCDFNTSNKKDYTRHMQTNKHISNHFGFLAIKKPQKTPDDYTCECGKSYKDNSGLWRHKKKCNLEEDSQTLCNGENTNESANINKNELIQYLLKENGEFKEMLIEQNKAVMKVCDKTTGIINNSNINSNNKMFNLNVFLNEECKDAMNIMEFIDSLKIQLSDLESVGKLGYVEGISNIIVKNLKALDVHKRPVHCSDSKREIMYVKDENKWEKDNQEKNKLRTAIKHIAHKNSKMLPVFKAKYPDCIYSASQQSNQYNKIVVEAMGGSGDNDSIKENKIIKKIAKEVVIDRTKSDDVTLSIIKNT
jgi:hypothetical protein